MAVAVVLIIAVTVIVIVVLLLRRHDSTKIQRLCVIIFSLKFCDHLHLLSCRGQMSVVDITAKSNEAYELTKLSEEPTYM